MIIELVYVDGFSTVAKLYLLICTFLNLKRHKTNGITVEARAYFIREINL